MKVFNNNDIRDDVKTIYIGFKKNIPHLKKSMALFGMGWKEWSLILLLGAVIVLSAPPEMLATIKHTLIEFIK